MPCRLLSEGHVAFLETVPFRAIAFFTVLQFIGLAAVYVVSSWTGVSLAAALPVNFGLAGLFKSALGLCTPAHQSV